VVVVVVNPILQRLQRRHKLLVSYCYPVLSLYNSDILPFGQHMTNMVNNSPALILFQLLRGIIWASLAGLVIQMTTGNWWIKGIIIGLLFGVMATGGLLLPNPYMPAEVRWIHLWETSTSNFLFGFVAGWILRWPKVKHRQDPLTSG